MGLLSTQHYSLCRISCTFLREREEGQGTEGFDPDVT